MDLINLPKYILESIIDDYLPGDEFMNYLNLNKSILKCLKTTITYVKQLSAYRFHLHYKMTGLEKYSDKRLLTYEEKTKQYFVEVPKITNIDALLETLGTNWEQFKDVMAENKWTFDSDTYDLHAQFPEIILNKKMVTILRNIGYSTIGVPLSAFNWTHFVIRKRKIVGFSNEAEQLSAMANFILNDEESYQDWLNYFKGDEIATLKHLIKRSTRDKVVFVL